MTVSEEEAEVVSRVYKARNDLMTAIHDAAKLGIEVRVSNGVTISRLGCRVDITIVDVHVYKELTP